MAARKDGKQGHKAEKIWRDAVMRAVKRKDKDPKVLEKLADKLVEEGLRGNMAALKEIGDRLDGRPAQAVEVSGTMTHKNADVTDEIMTPEEWAQQAASSVH